MHKPMSKGQKHHYIPEFYLKLIFYSTNLQVIERAA